MLKGHENYKELIFRLARTDFKLRYQASVLGYVWAILKPLLLFAILNFVFSSVFNARGSGIPFYSLQLLTGLLLFNFFAEGTSSGIMSLVSKAQLVTKIYVPRWVLVVSSTMNSFFVFCTNLFILAIFFAAYGKLPSFLGCIVFVIYALCLYVFVVSVSLVLAPLHVRFRDIFLIWEVLLSVFMYSAPVVYPLAILPAQVQKLVLLNPLAFVVHFSKQGLVENHFAAFGQIAIFIGCIAIFFIFSVWIFSKTQKGVAEHI